MSRDGNSKGMEVKHNIPKGSRGLAQSAFDLGVSFHEAALRSTEPVRDGLGVVSPTGPAIVCAAFACELYLKALQGAASQILPRGHELEKLFGGIPILAQQSIRDDYDVALSKYGFILKDDLTEISRAFEKWRYMYEEDGQHVNQAAVFMFARAIYLTVRATQSGWPVTPYLHKRLSNIPAGLVLRTEHVGGGVVIQVVLAQTLAREAWSWGWSWR